MAGGGVGKTTPNPGVAAGVAPKIDAIWVSLTTPEGMDTDLSGTVIVLTVPIRVEINMGSMVWVPSSTYSAQMPSLPLNEQE